MDGYKRVRTSAEVWAVIRARHPEMVVFGSYSAPNGDHHGDPTKAKMFTSYGFEGCDYPVMEAESTWDIGEGYKRNNEKHEYWLCLPMRETDGN
jgi:alpha-L-fucosidase